MPYEVTADEDHETIMVRLWDSLTPAEHRVARCQAAALCTERQFQKMLVDLRDLSTKDFSTTMTCYDFGETLARGAVPRGTWLAHVMPTDATAHRDVHFTLSVAKNRGGLIEEFTTVADAAEWLQSTARA
jgi:hypothetical protein